MDSNNIKQCFMDYVSSVDRDDFVIPGHKDESIKAVYMKNNSNIEFLPVQIYRKFPNLLQYSMINCELSEIFKKNFEHLNQLQLLDLSDNRIEIIRSDTFEGLSRLENIFLSKLKFITVYKYVYAEEHLAVSYKCVHIYQEFSKKY